MKSAVPEPDQVTDQPAFVPGRGRCVSKSLRMNVKVLFPILALMLLLALFFVVGYVHAHSTEGRVRVTLDWGRPSVDDFAYFIEPYVNQEKYKGQHQPYRGRFYVMDFDRVEFKGRRAAVYFEVLDVRSNDRFVDSMQFVRSPDGVWRHGDDESTAREVFSYIPEWHHSLNQFGRPAAMIGVPLLAVGLVLLQRRRRISGRNVDAKVNDQSVRSPLA